MTVSCCCSLRLKHRGKQTIVPITGLCCAVQARNMQALSRGKQTTNRATGMNFGRSVLVVGSRDGESQCNEPHCNDVNNEHGHVKVLIAGFVSVCFLKHCGGIVQCGRMQTLEVMQLEQFVGPPASATLPKISRWPAMEGKKPANARVTIWAAVEAVLAAEDGWNPHHSACPRPSMYKSRSSQTVNVSWYSFSWFCCRTTNGTVTATARRTTAMSPEMDLVQ